MYSCYVATTKTSTKTNTNTANEYGALAVLNKGVHNEQNRNKNLC